MHMLTTALVSLTAMVAHTSAHGLVSKPATRLPGDATAAVCGKPMVAFYKADETSYPEALKRQSGWDSGLKPAQCNLYLCKGFQFEDNKDNVQKYKPGDVIDLEVKIRIPHKGYANVSVVDLAANAVIGEPLKKWADNYAATSSPPKDQTQFSIKLPDFAGKCTVPGQCVCFPSCLSSLHSDLAANEAGGGRLSSGTGLVRARPTSRASTLSFRRQAPRLSRRATSGQGRSNSLATERTPLPPPRRNHFANVMIKDWRRVLCGFLP